MGKIKSTIDAVIPLHNGEPYLQETVESLAAQTLKPSRIIIVDDHSTDSSYELAKSLPWTEVHKNPKSTGKCSSARNHGAGLATADYVMFSDQDDVYHPRHLELLAGVLDDNPQAPAAAAFYVPFRGNETPRYEVDGPAAYPESMWDVFPYSNFAEPSLVLFRRDIFRRVQWNENFPGLADHYIWLELTMEGKIMRLPVKTVGRRLHETSYFMQMAQDPLSLARQWCEANETLVNAYVQSCKDSGKVEFMKRRHKVGLAVRDVTQAAVEMNKKALEKNLADLRALISKENREFIDLVAGELWIMLARAANELKTGPGPGAYLFFLGGVTISWPEAAEFFEKKIVAMRPGWRFYLKSPAIYNPRLLYRALVSKL